MPIRLGICAIKREQSYSVDSFLRTPPHMSGELSERLNQEEDHHIIY